MLQAEGTSDESPITARSMVTSRDKKSTSKWLKHTGEDEYDARQMQRAQEPDHADLTAPLKSLVFILGLSLESTPSFGIASFLSTLIFFLINTPLCSTSF